MVKCVTFQCTGILKMCGIDLIFDNCFLNMSYSISVIEETFIIFLLI